MKILIISQFYYPEKFTISDIASELVKYGHEVTVITGKPNYGFGKIVPEYKKVKYEIINGVEVFRVKVSPRKKSRISIIRNYLSYYKHAKRFVRHFNQEFDVVLSVSLSPVISIAPACLYAKKHNVPHILYCLDLWPESTVTTGAVREGSLLYKILYRWSKKLYQKCDKIILSSPSFKQYFSKVLFLDNIPTTYIPQPALSYKAELTPITYKAKFNFVYAGNIGSVQMVDILVKAMANFKKDDDVQLHIIGMGKDSIYVQKLISDLKLDNKVIMYGPKPVEETVRLYKNADALIVSLADRGYVGKTIPNKLIQYLSFAKPIVGVIKGDGRDLLIKAGGSIISEDNQNAVFEAYQKVISLSKKEKDNMGQNNLEFYQDNLTLDHISRQIELVLKDSIK